MEKSLNWREFIITASSRPAGYSAIVFVALIFYFLLREGLPALGEVKLSDLFSTRWYPIEDHFGILPLITGSLIVTIGAMLIAIPFGIGDRHLHRPRSPRAGCARSSSPCRAAGRAALGGAGLPGHPGAGALPAHLPGPAHRPDRPGRLAAPGRRSPSRPLSRSPRTPWTRSRASYREGAWALGATRWQTIWRVTLPAARSGVLTARHAGHRAHHRRDHGRDDGHRQRAGAGHRH